LRLLRNGRIFRLSGRKLRGFDGNGRTLSVAPHPSGYCQRTHSCLRDELPPPDRTRLWTLGATSDQCAATPMLDVMIDLAVRDMMMNCVTHGMGFARTVAYRLVFMEDKLIVESDPR
ncbi:MAG: hypothetical protein ABGY13_03265, partial [Verrucomicrobiia bacterium]